jgi:hypothetical protein
MTGTARDREAEGQPPTVPERADPELPEADGQPKHGTPSVIVREWRVRREPPRLLCCEPEWHPFPSGWVWTHGEGCEATVERRGHVIRRRRQKVEVPPDEVWLDLPSPGSRADAWLAHPPGHQCADCLYTEAHLDDDDDDGLPLPAVLEREGADDDRRAG